MPFIASTAGACCTFGMRACPDANMVRLRGWEGSQTILEKFAQSGARYDAYGRRPPRGQKRASSKQGGIPLSEAKRTLRVRLVEEFGAPRSVKADLIALGLGAAPIQAHSQGIRDGKVGRKASLPAITQASIMWFQWYKAHKNDRTTRYSGAPSPAFPLALPSPARRARLLPSRLNCSCVANRTDARGSVLILVSRQQGRAGERRLRPPFPCRLGQEGLPVAACPSHRTIT